MFSYVSLVRVIRHSMNDNRSRVWLEKDYSRLPIDNTSRMQSHVLVIPPRIAPQHGNLHTYDVCVDKVVGARLTRCPLVLA